MDEQAKRIVERFAMQPHPEGGYFREVYRSALELDHPAISSGQANRRNGCTFIYFLLPSNQFSAFHRVKGSDELWHLYAGGPLELHLIDAGGRHTCLELTTGLDAGEPTGIVPAGVWQAARPAPGARFAFAGCTVAPGFDFADFEMPRAEALVDAYPRHEALIRELTRS